MKHTNRWTLNAHYTFFSWISTAHNSKICTKLRLYKINSLTSVANNNTVAGPT